MILRRLADAARRQDWTVVGIELIVVVVGIFLGLQVDNWNETRKSLREEASYLSRLAVELEANRTATQQRVESHREREKVLRELVAVLGGERSEVHPPDGIQPALCRWFVMPTSEISTTTFDEIVNAGKLELIRDPETRRLIQAAYAAHETWRYQIELLATPVRELARELSPHIDWGLEEAGSGFHCRFDLEAMAADPGALSTLVQLARSQRVYAEFRQLEADADGRAIGAIRATREVVR